MDRRIPRSILAAAAVFGLLLLLYVAYSRPWYFSSQVYLGGLILLEFLIAAIWNYRGLFFVLLILSFLFAGANLPLGGVWTSARWAVLGTGAGVGLLMILKDRQHRFNLFHVVALFAVLTAAVSAAVSRYPGVALLKTLGLLLLFLYGATGARLAVAGRETHFFTGLVTGCEILVGVIAAFYLVGIEVLGNRNSLGALMGVVAAPVLLWGTLVAQEAFVRRRRLVMLLVCLGLVFYSQARAGMVAAVISCGLLCVSLRKYRVLMQGVGIILILIATAAIVAPEDLSNSAASLTSALVYKVYENGERSQGMLGSRETPWRRSLDTIGNHFWFGTGFGTEDNGQDASEHMGKFSSNREIITEHGSSYLALATWVGVLGVLPFFLLLLGIVAMVYRTVAWTMKTGNGSHPAVPLAMIMVAGMVHAGLEDWLFATGYYISVFYWSMAFVLVDLTPAAPHNLPSLALSWRPRPVPQGLGGIASSR